MGGEICFQRGVVRRCASSDPPVSCQTPPLRPPIGPRQAAPTNTTPHFAALRHNFADNLPVIDKSSALNNNFASQIMGLHGIIYYYFVAKLAHLKGRFEGASPSVPYRK